MKANEFNVTSDQVAALLTTAQESINQVVKVISVTEVGDFEDVRQLNKAVKDIKRIRTKILKLKRSTYA